MHRALALLAPRAHRRFVGALAASAWLLACASTAAFAAAAPADRSAGADADAEAGAAEERAPYRVVVDGPAPLAAVVQRSLGITRRDADRPATRARIERLARGIPEEAANILAAEGYFSAKVTVDLQTATEPWILMVHLDPGEPTRVTAVDLRFVGPITEDGDTPNRSTARAAWPLATGQVFRQEDWESAKREVLRHLLARRYPAARIVTSEAEVDPATQSARLAVEYASGPEYRFGAVTVKGLARYAPAIVANLNPIRPGTVYSQAALADLQSKVQSVPYFSGVTVTADPQAGDPQALPIVIEVTEADRRRVELGGGYSSDAGVRAQATYTDIDFLGRGLRWRNALRVDQKQQTAGTQLAWPVRADGWQDDVGLAWSHSFVNRLDVNAVTFTAKRAKTEGRIERAVTFLAAFSGETPEGGNRTLKQALVPGYAWRYRALDNVLDPRRGWDFGVQVGVGAKVALSDQNLVRTYGRLIFLHPLSARDTIVLRAEGGAVLAPSRQGIPEQLLFRTGGDVTVRGYGYQTIGVKDADAIVGGRYLAVASAEYIRWIAPRYGVAVFYDRGDAFDDLKLPDWKSGYGIGARLRTPVGPINIDLAYGEQSKSLRFHLSLGFYF